MASSGPKRIQRRVDDSTGTVSRHGSRKPREKMASGPSMNSQEAVISHFNLSIA